MEFKILTLEYHIVAGALCYYDLDNDIIYMNCSEIPDNYDIIVLNNNLKKTIDNNNYILRISDNICAIYYNIKFGLYNCGLIKQLTENNIFLEILYLGNAVANKLGKFYFTFMLPEDNINDYLPIIIFNTDANNNNILRSLFKITKINDTCHLLEKRGEIMVKAAIKNN